ncbi:MAG: amidohydrolase family protein [Bryobacteraceae bacterium]
MNRRIFLTAAAVPLADMTAQTAPIPIIDTHIHLFDPTRPEGVPWPPKTNPILYKSALPARYSEVTKGLNVVGAIEVECSTWLEDNQWVLDVSGKDKIMVGMIGNLEPGNPGFRHHLDRFHKNPLYLGIRYGNLWNRNPTEELKKPEFAADLKALAAAGLTLDTANPRLQLLQDMLRISDLVPNLRIVIDHLPNMPLPKEPAERAAYHTAMREFRKRPQVYVKVSEVLQRSGERVSYEVSTYRAKLDEMWETFGADRVLYGSDWPNSDPLGAYPQVLGVVREYFAGKGREASEKYFWKNSIAAYKWVKRDPSQPRV